MKPNMAAGPHLEKWTQRHNHSVESGLTLTKFGRPMQNDTLMTKIRSKSKPGVEFQYGGCPVSETGSSYISAVD